MAKRHGRNGALYMGVTNSSSTPEPIANLSSWSVDFTTDQVDVTSFGDNFKSYVSGLPDFSGQYQGFWGDAENTPYAAAVDGSPRRFYFYPDRVNQGGSTGKYWFGAAFFDFSISTPVDGAVAISGNIRGAAGVSSSGIL
jgi:hypothetical protein